MELVLDTNVIVDYLLYNTAVSERADAFVTRDKNISKSGPVPFFDCDGLFEWLNENLGVNYDEVEF